jgi:hypothetical protein
LKIRLRIRKLRINAHIIVLNKYRDLTLNIYEDFKNPNRFKKISIYSKKSAKIKKKEYFYDNIKGQII